MPPVPRDERLGDQSDESFRTYRPRIKHISDECTSVFDQPDDYSHSLSYRQRVRAGTPLNVLDVCPVSSMSDALTQLTVIDACLEPTDGLSAFNRMYLTFAHAISDAVVSDQALLSPFVADLELAFVNHYLAALRRASSGEPVPKCWALLWRHRAASDRVPVQFALAGMNAHINHDLVLALLETFDKRRITPHDTQVQDEFTRFNALIGWLEPVARRDFHAALEAVLARPVDPVDGCVGLWSIAMAREFAWRDAAALWAVRLHEPLRARLLVQLDEAVTLASRCLLVPSGRHRHAGVAEGCVEQMPSLSMVPPARRRHSS